MIPVSTILTIQNYSYDTHDEVGKGTYASVYKAFKDSDPNTPYALKVIDITKMQKPDTILEKFKRGIDLLSKFHSENVIKLLDHIFLEENTKKLFYLFFEFGEEGSLEKKLKDSPLKIEYEGNDGTKVSVSYLAEDEVIPIILQIVNGCRDLAREKIIHRDLKPSNIVFKNQIVKIIDLDFAKCIDKKDTFGIGTYGYKSPEVFYGKFENLDKCDIWSLGMIIYELLYGRFPWIQEVICESKFYDVEARETIHFPKFPIVSFKMKRLIRKLLVFDFEKRLDWNGIWKLVEELGFGKDVVGPPTKKSKTKVNVSLYYEDSSKEKENSKEEGNTVMRNRSLEKISKKKENSRSNSLWIPKKLKKKYSKKNDLLVKKEEVKFKKDEEFIHDNENHNGIIKTTEITKKTMIDLTRYYSDQKFFSRKILINQ